MKMKLLLFIALSGVFTFITNAEEGGSGHYMPGSISDFVDGVPPKEAFAVRYNMLNYNGSVTANQPLPIAALKTLSADATIWAHGLTLLWRPPIDLGDRWSYAMSTTVPVMWADVTAKVVAGTTTVRRSSSVNGLGDIVLMPLMLNYNIDSNLNVETRLGIYAPTGDYEVGRLANTGKNFWTFEPTLGLRYFGAKNGREASVFVGADFNTQNEDTSYTSGTQFHVDGTLAQHLPLFGGLAGLGVNAFWYDQITGDSGSGATLGDFEGHTTGVGPVLSYVTKVRNVDVIGEVKWLHEVDTTLRLQGDIVWFKLVAKF